jgi:aerobic carbon-monoxide dehydrogenase small subunit
MNEQIVSMTVNGFERRLSVPANKRLIDVLRQDLALTGVKEGCGVGVCGACTVLLDGRAVSACLTFAFAADGAHVQTIEGLAQDGELHPLQAAFIEKGGLQCGYCTPGQIMAAKALLDENPDPTEDEIKHAMMGNLCRCTGYYQIIESIQSAAAAMREPQS